MIKKLIKQFNERNYFNSEEAREVNLEDFLKILRGEVKSGRPYMVAGVPEGHAINSWAGQKWGVNSYEIAQDSALWYGKFTCDQQSRIIISSRKEVIDFNPFSKNELGKFYASTFKVEPWRAGGFMQLDKDLNYKTLVSNLSVEEILDSVSEVYKK